MQEEGTFIVKGSHHSFAVIRLESRSPRKAFKHDRG